MLIISCNVVEDDDPFVTLPIISLRQYGESNPLITFFVDFAKAVSSHLFAAQTKLQQIYS